MCIPPDNQDPKPFFKHLLALNQKLNLSEISMGMTNDYLDALFFALEQKHQILGLCYY